MPKRVLLLVSGSGGGHIQAGKNVARAFREVAPDVACVLKDSYDFVTRFERWQLTRGWEIVFQYFRPLYAAARHRFNASPRAQATMRKKHEPSAREFVAWLKRQEPFDAIITTQPHGASIASTAKCDPQFARTYVAQIWTDFWYYGLYYSSGVDRYFAPAEEFAAAARAEHPSTRVTVSGVPIDLRYTVQPDTTTVRQSFGLPADVRPVVLVARGSLGYGAWFTLTLLDQLARSGLPITIVANAGRNAALTRRMRAVLSGSHHVVLDWIDNMHELLAVTDLTVAKPGGLAVAEALARGVPMFGFSPIPGQEEANLKFLAAHEVGRQVQTPAEAVAAVGDLVGHPDRLAVLRQRARALGFPDASARIVRQVLADLADRD